MEKADSKTSKSRKKVLVTVLLLITSVVIGFEIYHGNRDAYFERKAYSTLVDLYGEDYVEEHIELLWIERNPSNRRYDRTVFYHYNLEIGEDYTVQKEVYLKFDIEGNISRSHGLPDQDNLMPFTIDKSQALEMAAVKMTETFEETGVNLEYMHNFNDTSKEEKYLWLVNFYHTPRSLESGVWTLVQVDPITGEILSNHTSDWATSN